MKLITPELKARFAEVGNQSEIKDPIIVAKFFNPCGSATWYATDYNPKTNICFGYVTGMAVDEWGSFSIDELESLESPSTVIINGTKYTPRMGVRIERDLYFKEKTFYEQFPEQLPQRMSELKEIDQDNSNEQELEQE